MFISNGKPKVPGADKECKRKKITVPMSFLLQRRLQDLHHRTWTKKQEIKRRWSNFLSGLFG